MGPFIIISFVVVIIAIVIFSIKGTKKNDSILDVHKKKDMLKIEKDILKAERDKIEQDKSKKQEEIKEQIDIINKRIKELDQSIGVAFNEDVW
jgi:hypothetical protein